MVGDLPEYTITELPEGYLNVSTVVFEFRGGTSAAAYADVTYDAK